MIHADNARSHSAKTVAQFLDQNSLRRAPHSPSSRDLTPSDFWLSGDLKGVVQRNSFDERDELLSAIQEILQGVDCETFDAGFQEWMIRLQKCIDRNGEYVE
jgi:hypothetical protein